MTYGGWPVEGNLLNKKEKTLKKYYIALPLLGLCSAMVNASDITVDGTLDELVWQDAMVIDDFVTTSPYSLAEPEYKTEVRVHTNEQGIFIGITNHQPKASQLSNRSSRDAWINADSNSIILDFDNTGVAAYRFSVGNGGSILDGTYRNENSFSSEWDGVWYAKTSVGEDKWFTEVLIPWDVAPMISAVDGARSMGLHVERHLQSQQKTFASHPIHQSRQRFLSDIVPVTIKDYSGASLQTFASITARQDRVADENSQDISLDLFWKPDSSKQLSLTVNPDFGHVDSDSLVVNFSPTETFFSENRAFFTENQSLFSMTGPEGLRLVHTRRIGGRPDVGDALGADIKGAAKFTSTEDGFSYGVFAAREDDNGEAKGRDFYSGRILRKTDDYNIGYLVTYTDRPDIDRDAIVQAMDYGYFVNEDVTLKGQVMHSEVSQEGEAQSDVAGWFDLGQQFSENWEHSFVASYYGEDFEVNDLGFLPRNNLVSLQYDNSLKSHDFSDDSAFQEHQMTASVFYEENMEGLILNSSLRFRDAWFFKDSSWGQWVLTLEDKAQDDLITRGNHVLNLDQGAELDLLYFGDSSGKLRYHLHATFYDRMVAGNGYMLHAHPSYYFSDNYVLSLGLWYTKADDWLVWQQDNRLNSFKRNELNTNVELNATIDEKQQLTFRLQWVALAAEGQDAYRVDSNGELSLLNEEVNDFSVSDTAIQLRYRYEIAPLSNIYLVYSRGGRTSLNEEKPFSSLFTPGWDARDGDNISLKVRYQF